MAATVWIDVEDLFEYANENTRPSGIQRLAFEIYRELHARRTEADIRFVRHTASGTGFGVVPWSDIAALFADLTDRRLTPTELHGKRRLSGGSGRVERLLRPLPDSWRPAATEVAASGVSLARALSGLAAALARQPKRGMPRPASGPTPVHAMAHGDVILVLGSPWSITAYDGLIRRHRDQFGTRFALLVYDLIPLRRPEWCDAALVRRFREWLLPMLPLCDHVFAISRFSAADFEAFAAGQGVVLPCKVRTIPIGTTRLAPAPADGAAEVATGGATGGAAGASSGRVLPPPGSYALIVSTIEARKNHLLLFRVWRRLLEEMPPDQVPTLVFAGRVGWLVDDLMRQISNTGYLDGKLIVWESPTDAELASLYAGCRFTLFPSLYEGWGLPVTESLAAGKPCLTSNGTSMPEAGAGLTRMFDPDNLHDATAKIRAAIEDEAGLAAWQAQVRRDFRPVPWSASAEALLSGLFGPEPDEALSIGKALPAGGMLPIGDVVTVMDFADEGLCGD